jgi:CRISPR-associated endonuclease Csn1
MRIFGLDIGTTSIGFAVIDQIDDQTGSIQRLGVRIFPEARDPDGTPLNQQRRAKRMMRRQLRRRRERRRTLNELLNEAGFLPAFNKERASEWSRVMQVDPYELRNRGITQALNPQEFGRAIYHLAKRRHFKERELAEGTAGSNGGNQSEELNADKAAQASDREAFVDRLRQSGETLGQTLARRDVPMRKRGVHATRAIVQEEFEYLWMTQSTHHPQLKNTEFQRAIEGVIFSQRPVFWRKSTLGTCRFLPGEPLCPKGSWVSQQRRMLEKVNNLAIVGGNARPLNEQERAAILSALTTQKSMSWPGVRKALEPIFKSRGESTKSLRFNLEYGDEKGGLKGNLVEVELAKALGSNWKDYPNKETLRRMVPEALWQADYGEVGTQRVVIRSERDRQERRVAFGERLVADFGLARSQAENLIKLQFPQGWEPFSTRFIEVALSELENGVRFGTLINGPEYESWREANFPNHESPTGEFLDRLPSPQNRDEARRIASVRNPTVVRVQNEVRKVVNNLIGLYGKPDLIRIELARDVGKSKREREEMTAGMRKRERERERARKDLIANGVAVPSNADVEKWLLWKESQERCPYTGDQIGFDALFRGQPRFEIEHIWPLSISLDDSFRNKTLCRKDVNVAKGNRTPFEYFGGREDEWAAVKDRVWKMVGRDGMSPGKAKRFASEKPLDDDFANRQLTDTAYATRQVRGFLQRLWPDMGTSAPIKVQAVAGRLTAQLRKYWGLNNILSDDGEKTRADHRHHAIDALVVACAHGGYSQRLSIFYKAKLEGVRPHLPEPWASIRQDAQAAVGKMVVSHRVRKKISGPLHLETVYGNTGKNIRTKNGTYRLFVTRKPVERLSNSEVEQIVDERVRTTVQTWIANHGGDPKKAFTEHPCLGETGPKIRKVRLLTKQQLSLMVPISTGYADSGENHHITVFRNVDNKIEYEVVSLFEAARRLSRHEPVIRRNRSDGAQFLMSLTKGDTVEYPSGDMKGLWVVQSIWSSGQIVFWLTTDADGKSVTRPTAASLIKANAHKVSVDPIGRVRKAGD